MSPVGLTSVQMLAKRPRTIRTVASSFSLSVFSRTRRLIATVHSAHVPHHTTISRYSPSRPLSVSEVACSERSGTTAEASQNLKNRYRPCSRSSRRALSNNPSGSFTLGSFQKASGRGRPGLMSSGEPELAICFINVRRPSRVLDSLRNSSDTSIDPSCDAGSCERIRRSLARGPPGSGVSLFSTFS